MAMWELHQRTEPGTAVTVTFPTGDGSGWSHQRIGDVVEGAGFSVDQLAPPRPTGSTSVEVRCTRVVSLADTVGPQMSLLIVGLNPSVHAATAGVGFARPGNRFWPAAIGAGLVSVDRDAQHALTAHGVGMTDVAKRATPRADELTAAEIATGFERLDRLTRWLEPGVIVVAGVTAWRHLEPNATLGIQERELGGRPVYLMPNPSGANAHAQLPDLIEHLSTAAAVSRRPPRSADSPDRSTSSRPNSSRGS